MTRKGVLEEGSLPIPGGAIVPTPNSPGPEGGLSQLRPVPESARVLCAPMNRVRGLGAGVCNLLIVGCEEKQGIRGLRSDSGAGVSHCLYLEAQGARC